MENIPFVSAQRKKLESLFGPAAQKGVLQCKLYSSPHVPKIAGWDPYNNPWPGSKGASGYWGGYANRGSDVKGSAAKLCDDVTKLTQELSGGEVMGHPHMVPQRMGGKGIVGNVRPWSQAFENTSWHGALDPQIYTHFRDDVKSGEDLYEDIETVDSHIYTSHWLRPLTDRYEKAADNADRAKLKLYLDHANSILEPVPDDAKVTASGSTFQPSGVTFTPPPLDMIKAKTALNNYNGGNLDNVKQDPANAKPVLEHVKKLCDSDNVEELKKLSSNLSDWTHEAWSYYLDWLTTPKV